mmetsp:Transcript_35750/g.57476  ORF Transcript_35750/g.57476 Transcript_35750/m.57476 type:complete len:243 (-) Transcript_35750:1115-1843(-)
MQHTLTRTTSSTALSRRARFQPLHSQVSPGTRRERDGGPKSARTGRKQILGSLTRSRTRLSCTTPQSLVWAALRPGSTMSPTLDVQVTMSCTTAKASPPARSLWSPCVQNHRTADHPPAHTRSGHLRHPLPLPWGDLPPSISRRLWCSTRQTLCIARRAWSPQGLRGSHQRQEYHPGPRAAHAAGQILSRQSGRAESRHAPGYATRHTPLARASASSTCRHFLLVSMARAGAFVKSAPGFTP